MFHIHESVFTISILKSFFILKIVFKLNYSKIFVFKSNIL